MEKKALIKVSRESGLQIFASFPLPKMPKWFEPKTEEELSSAVTELNTAGFEISVEDCHAAMIAAKRAFRKHPLATMYNHFYGPTFKIVGCANEPCDFSFGSMPN